MNTPSNNAELREIYSDRFKAYYGTPVSDVEIMSEDD